MSDNINESSELNKIDRAASLGLAGTADSLGYRIGEIERHFHHWERWLGKAVTPSGETHVADKLGVGVLAFQIDAGNNDWGAWTQILGSADTPVIAGSVKFDFHRLMITATERSAYSFIQFAFGDVAATAFAAGNYSSIIFAPAGVVGEQAPLDIQTRRIASGTKVWARTLCPGQNTATIDFYFGVHEYEG